MRKFKPRKMPIAVLLAAWVTLLMAMGCQDTSSTSGGLKTASTALDIDGNYVDEFSTTHTITDSSWTAVDSFGTSVYHILSYSNGGRFLIAQNDAANGFNPDLFSRFDWTVFNGDLYVCQAVFDGASAAAAEAGQADSSDPAAGGCNVANDFPWTNFTPPVGP